MIKARQKGQRFELKSAKVWQGMLGGNVERIGYGTHKLDDHGVGLNASERSSTQLTAHVSIN